MQQHGILCFCRAPAWLLLDSAQHQLRMAQPMATGNAECMLEQTKTANLWRLHKAGASCWRENAAQQ
jgi:hypothetical protein